MNPLCEALPTAIRVAGEVYPVRTGWRDCMRIILAFEDEELTQREKLTVMTRLLYKKTPPPCGETFTQAVRFLNCGEEARGEGPAAGRLYSFQRDARLIYPAFRQSHGIDLADAKLHWWEFCWLFLDLREDCAFCRLVGLRARKRGGTLTREERAGLAGLEPLLELPGQYSPEERERMESFLQSMGQVR